MDRIISPITGLPNTKVFATISKSDIIHSYYNYLDVSVERFFINVDKVNVVQCLDTNYLFYYPFNILGDEEFYNDLKNKMFLKYQVPYYSDWKWEYELSIKLIKPEDKVYEIGCGSGNFLAKLKEKGVKCAGGSELNHDSVRKARSKGLDVEYISIEEKAMKTTDQYDIVCCFQVLEHVCDVKSFLNASIKTLKKSGRLILAVPYNYPYLFKNDKLNTLNMPPHHMGLWNREAFQNLPNFYPLDIDSIVIEKLPLTGYDFEQFFTINKDVNYGCNKPFKSFYDKLYYYWLKKFHTKYPGKNIIAVFQKL